MGDASSPAVPQRALFLIHDLAPGGAERVFLTYARSLLRYDVIPVLVRRRIEMLDGLDPQRVLDLGPPGPSAGPITRREIPAAALALARKAWRLRTLAERQQARLISTFLHKSHIIALTAKLQFDRRLRVVLNVHELLSQHLEHHFHPALRPLMAWYARRYFPRADGIVAIADGVKQDLVERFGVPADLITVVPNPLDLEQIRERAREPLDGEIASGPLIVAVTRLVKLKGIDFLLRAFALLPAELGANLIILGTGDERALLVELSRSLGVADRVRFVGHHDNPWKYMARADVMALPSLTEGFPNVIGEALALGLPVVAADCSPGVSEYLEGGRAGLLVRPADPVALSEGLLRILTNVELRNQLRARGPERVRAFDVPLVIPLYERLLDTVT
jgi:glycosyltransferase involved in cell wall biosynthesis